MTSQQSQADMVKALVERHVAEEAAKGYRCSHCAAPVDLGNVIVWGSRPDGAPAFWCANEVCFEAALKASQ